MKNVKRSASSAVSSSANEADVARAKGVGPELAVQKVADPMAPVLAVRRKGVVGKVVVPAVPKDAGPGGPGRGPRGPEGPGFRPMGPPPSPAELFKEFDADKNDQLSVEEFEKLMGHLRDRMPGPPRGFRGPGGPGGPGPEGRPPRGDGEGRSRPSSTTSAAR
jgi:hypothetical protein